MLINYVEKRNGEIVEFQKDKIEKAIFKASKSKNSKSAEEIANDITNKVIEYLEVKFNDNDKENCPTVEEIQNLVETFLMKEGHYKIAKAYIIYREKHNKIRNTKNAFEDALTSMKGYLDQMDWRVNENSNMSYSLQGLNNFIVDEITSEHWLQNIYSDEIEKSHKSGDLHIHDLGLLSVYCFTGDTKIKLLDGTTPTIKELAEGKKGKEFWVYSIDNDGNIVPGKAYNARKTRTNANLVEVKIDTGEKIRCTPDHKFMMRDGSYKQAKHLRENDSLMPLYSKPTNSGYETIWNFKGRNGFENYEYTHRLITNAKKGEAVHHKNENKRDNRPENLTKMNDSKHRSMEIQKTMDKSDMLNKNGKRLIKMNKQKWKKKQMSDFAKNRPRDEKGRFISKGNNHKVVNVSKLTKKEDVYDIAVKKHHNFALEAGVFVHNCVGWDLKDLLLQGFRGVPTKTESKPPKHLKTAFGQVVNFFYSLQGEAAGAQALSNFDTYLAPFIAYDNLSYKEVKQAMQEFIFNINVPTRVGFQSPFTNITMDLKVPKHMKEEFVIIGGEYQERQFGEFQEEMDMLNKAFAEVMMSGDAKGRMFPFPIPTYSVTEDFDWNNETLDPVWEMTAKYGIPYWNNFINSDMDPEDTRSMCCRLNIDNKELRKRGGGLFGANPLTGSVGVVTLNLPRIAFQSNSEKEFMERIYELMDIAKDSLEVKRKVLEKLTDQGLYPYSKFYLRDIKKRFNQYWSNHFSTIGLVGMNEALLNLLGVTIADKEGNEFAERVLEKMKEKLLEYQKDTGNLYNLEATPAEGTSYSLAKKDRERFGNEIICANQKRVVAGEGEPYYTNSTQLPVGLTNDLFEALDLQDNLQSSYTGGSSFHAFIGEKLDNIETTKKLVKRIAENYKLPYYSITPTFSVCPVHGYIPGEHEYCPKCKAEVEAEEAKEVSTEDIKPLGI